MGDRYHVWNLADGEPQNAGGGRIGTAGRDGKVQPRAQVLNQNTKQRKFQTASIPSHHLAPNDLMQFVSPHPKRHPASQTPFKQNTASPNWQHSFAFGREKKRLDARRPLTYGSPRRYRSFNPRFNAARNNACHASAMRFGRQVARAHTEKVGEKNKKIWSLGVFLTFDSN